MDSDDDESIQFHEDQTDVGSVQFVEEDSESIQFYPDSESGTNKSSVRGSFAQQPGQWFNAVRQQPQQQQPPPVAAPPVQQPPAAQVQQQPQPQELPPPSAPAADASVSPTPRMEPAASMRSSSGDGKKKSVVQNILRSRGESVQRKLGSSLSSSNLNQQRQPPPQVQQQQPGQAAPQAVVEQPAAPAQPAQSAQSPVTETAKGDAPKMLNASFDFPSAVSQGEESESGTPADHRSPNERNNAIPPALQQQMQDQQKQQPKPAGKSGAGVGVQDIIGTSSTDSDVQIPVPRHGREATRAPTTASGASDGQSAGAPPPRNTGRRGTLPPPTVNHQRTGTATSIRSGGRVRLEEQHLQPRQDAGRAVLDHVEEQVMIQQQAQHEKQQVRPGSAGASRPGTAMSGTMPMLDLSGVTAGTMPQMPPAATYPAETPHDTPRLGAMNAEIVHARGLTDMCRAYNQMQADEVERIDAMLYDAKMDLDVLKHSLSQQEQQEQAKKAVLARGQRHMMEKAGGSPLATIVDTNARNGAPLVAAPVRRASGPVKPPVQQQAPKVVKQKPSPAAAPVSTPQTARVPSAGYAQAAPVTAAPVATSRLPPQQPPQRQAAPILTHQLTPPRERAHPRSASANRPAAKPRKAVTKAKPKRSTSSQAPRTLLPTSNDPVLLAARSFGVSAASLGTGTLYFTNGVALTPEQIETFSAAIEEQRRMGDGARSDAASATLLQGGGAYGGVGQTLSTAETAMLSPSKYHPPALLTKHSKPKTARKNSDNTMQDNGVHPSKRTKFTRTQVVRHAFNLLDFKQRGVLQGCVLDELEGVLAVDAAQCVDPSTSALLHAADPTIDPMAFAPSTRRKLSGLESIGGGGVKRFRRLCAFCNDVIIPVLRGSGHDEWEFSTVAQLVLREVPEDDAMMAALMAVPGSN